MEIFKLSDEDDFSGFYDNEFIMKDYYENSEDYYRNWNDVYEDKIENETLGDLVDFDNREEAEYKLDYPDNYYDFEGDYFELASDIDDNNMINL